LPATDSTGAQPAAVESSPLTGASTGASSEGSTEPSPEGAGSSGGSPGNGSPSEEAPSGSGEAPGGSGGEEAPPEESVAAGQSRPFRFFSATSFWNEEVPAEGPLDPSSATVMGAFSQEIAAETQAGLGPAINTTKWSVPVYVVPASQPTVRVRLVSASAQLALQSAWNAVPLPPNAQPAAGTDGHLAVWQPSTERLWEFWRLAHGEEGWYAAAGGAMQQVSSNPGVYGPEAWPGAQPWWGGWASSLSLVGGLITLEDLSMGQINHALVIAIPHVRAGVYSSPAQRTDGQTLDPLSLPEGAHLRLDPKLNLATLHLPRVTLMIAEAAQRYGIFVGAGSGVVNLYGQDPTPTGTEPYGGAGGYFEGQISKKLLAAFPWSHLELLKMELHSVV
jgi:hypothetical protein